MTYFCKAIDWLNPLLHLLGLCVAIWGFRPRKRKGFLLLIIYFALTSFSLIAVPHVNRMLYERFDAMDDSMQQEINVAVQDAIDAVREKHGQQTYAAARTVSLPLAPLLLVAAVWVLAKEEQKRSSENSGQVNG